MPVDIAPTSRTKRPSRMPRAPRSRPLLIRVGARFDCFGDGLCCTDIHALGPVTRPEKRHLDLLVPGSLVRSHDLRAPVFRTQQHGACVLRSTRGCELHAVHGAAAKPTGCTRFPFNLVSTPDGGRVTTEHRCPCRTLGVRPLLTPEVAELSLRDSAGRLSANGKVGTRVALERGKRVAFSRFRAEESQVIADLLALREPFAALSTKPFGRLYQERWADVAEAALAERDDTAYGVAMSWLGRAIQVCSGTQRALDTSERPWSAAYDRAERRGPGRRRTIAPSAAARPKRRRPCWRISSRTSYGRSTGPSPWARSRPANVR